MGADILKSHILQWYCDLKLARERHDYREKYYDKYPKFAEWIDNIAIDSPTSADVTIRRIGYICRVFNLTPSDIAAMSQEQGYSLGTRMVKKLHAEKKTPGYINNYVTILKAYFEHNGKPINQKIRIPRPDGLTPTKVQEEQVPTPNQFGRILDNATIEQKVRATLVGFSGFRPETLGDFAARDGLRVMDLPELQIDKPAKKVEFLKIPAKIVCRPNLSKAGHQYFSFMPSQGCNYLQELLEQRLRNGESLKPDSFIVTSLKYAGKSRSDYRGGAVSTAKISASIRKAIRRAGLDIRPYILRSYFDMRLMAAEADGLILRDYRTFFMGHKGDIEHQYTTNKKGLPEDVVEQMRSQFARAAEKHLVTAASQDATTDKMREQFNRQMLEVWGYSPAEIEALGDLGALSPVEVNKLMQEKSKRNLGLNGNSQRVVPITEVKEWITQGWEYVTNLPTDEAVIRLPH